MRVMPGALPGVDRHLMKVRSRKFALDSALEGDGFEPSVPPQNFFGSIPQFTFRNINRLPRDRDRWFESTSLQRESPVRTLTSSDHGPAPVRCDAKAVREACLLMV